MAKIVMFGGTFNPFHKGHLSMMRLVEAAGIFDELRVIPSFVSPHKQSQMTPEYFAMSKHRVAMLKALLKSEKFKGIKVKLDDYEIKKETLSYTIDTLTYYREKHPNDELFFLMGSDSFFNFHFWKDAKKILSLSQLLVVRRDKETINKYCDYFKSQFTLLFDEHVTLFDNKPIRIASQHIRQANSLDLSQLLPPSIANYVRNKGLYA